MAARIVSAAVTGGVHTPSMSPHLPVTPQQIANDAIAACRAGAAIVHVHARDPQTGRPSSDTDVYGEIFDRIRSSCDAIICASTGGGLGMPASERVKVVKAHRPEMASFTAGSLNRGAFELPERMKVSEWKHEWERPYLYSTRDVVTANTFASMEEFTRAFEASGTRPEFEIFDSGMINNLAYLVDRRLAREPVYVQFVMGVMGGLPASVENLVFLRDSARRAFGNGLQWSACGAGRFQLPMCTGGLIMGGHVRVGLEDSLYAERGRLARSSAEQVEKIVRIARELGIDIATPAEARSILGLRAR